MGAVGLPASVTVHLVANTVGVLLGIGLFARLVMISSAYVLARVLVSLASIDRDDDDGGAGGAGGSCGSEA